MKEVEKQKTEDVAGGNDVAVPGGTPPYVPPPGVPSEPTFPMPLTQQPQ
jgi:hypothetical protein